jgi:hypothetical protein
VVLVLGSATPGDHSRPSRSVDDSKSALVIGSPSGPGACHEDRFDSGECLKILGMNRTHSDVAELHPPTPSSRHA